MFAQITKGLSESIGEALAKHAPAQNLGQNLSHQNITKSAQNLASQSLAPQVQTQTNTRQALTRFGNELAQNSQTKPTQAVFDFDFIARDKTPKLSKQTAQNSPSFAQADKGGGLFDLPSKTSQTSQTQKATPPQNQTAQKLPQNNENEVLQNLQHLANAPQEASHTTQAQNLAPHTPQSQSLQARYDTLYDFASKKSQAQRELIPRSKITL